MSDEVQPEQFGEQESAESGEQGTSWPGPVPPPEGGWSPPDAAWQTGSEVPASPGQPAAGPNPAPWPAFHPTAGAPQPSGPGQAYYLPPGQQSASYPPYGNQLAWGAPQMPVGSRRNRRFAVIGGGVAALLVVGVLIAVVALSGNGKHASVPVAGPTSPSAPASSATAQSTAAPTDSSASTPAVPLPGCSTASGLAGESVGYVACGSAAKDVGVPTYDSAQAHRTYSVTLKTNRGDVVFTATGANAPYTVYSFVYLVQKQYFDNTKCHRLTTKGIYVLQCGDPSGTGTGGPGYEFQDENLDAFGHVPAGGVVTYPAGTVAMANAGYGTNGSQFFLVYRRTELAPQYTPFGTITHGLGILTAIASKGTDNSLGDGDGSPVEPVTLESVTVSGS